MDIDMSALRASRAREGDLVLAAGRGHRGGAAHRLPAHRGPPADGPGRAGPQERARHGLGGGDRRRGQRRCASGTTPRPASGGSPRPRPSRSSCSGCATPRTSRPSASSPARRATSSPASIQQGKDPRNVFVDLGRIEAVLPPPEQVPGENYEHGSRLRCYVVQVRKGMRGPSIMLSRTHPNLVRKLFALEVPEIADGTVEIAAIAREAGHRTKIAVKSNRAGVNAKGSCIGPMGVAGPGGDGRAARREDRHRRLVGGPGARSSPRRCSRPGSPRSRSSTPRPGRPGSWCPTTSSRWRSARRARTPGSPPGSPAGGSTSGRTSTREPTGGRRPRSTPATEPA